VSHVQDSRISGRKFLRGFIDPEDGTDKLFRNVDKDLPLYVRNIPEDRRLQDVSISRAT